MPGVLSLGAGVSHPQTEEEEVTPWQWNYDDPFTHSLAFECTRLLFAVLVHTSFIQHLQLARKECSYLYNSRKAVPKRGISVRDRCIL